MLYSSCRTMQVLHVNRYVLGRIILVPGRVSLRADQGFYIAHLSGPTSGGGRSVLPGQQQVGDGFCGKWYIEMETAVRCPSIRSEWRENRLEGKSGVLRAADRRLMSSISFDQRPANGLVSEQDIILGYESMR